MAEAIAKREQAMDWKNADEKLATRAVDQGHVYLEAQLKLAASADGRAASLTGVFTTAAAALMAGLIALTISPHATLETKYPVLLGGGIAALLFLTAAAHCIAAILPIGFWLPGNQPKLWYDDVESNKPMVEALAEEARNVQEAIDDNSQTLARNARLFKRAAILAICAPTIGTTVWLISFSSVLVLAK